MDIKELAERANKLPKSPGVYIMMDKTGEVIYVGKAIALKNRVSSYFHGSHTPKTEMMVSKVATFDVIAANSEFEALVLENQLIKHHMPKYNIRLRDDKGHPFIRLDTREPYPRFTVVSKRRTDGARYLGPYSGRSIAYAAIDAVSKAFGLPTCTRKFPRDIGRERPCLNHQLGLCRGWCLAESTSEQYASALQSALAVFDGHAERLIAETAAEMETAAGELKFEQAARLRDRLKAVRELTRRQFVVSGAKADTDVIGWYRGTAKSCFVVLHHIEGKLLDKDYEILDTPLEDDGDALSSLLRQYYLRREVFPRSILLPEMPQDAEVIELLFTEAAERRVELAAPRRGDKRKLVETAAINAQEEAERASTREEKIRKTIEWLQKAMGLDAPPVRMEAYDISNTGSDNIVASMTVFENGSPRRASYRRFTIKSLESQDDYHSMEEVITRRAKRFLDGDEKFSPLPDVFLIDGGANHASIAKSALNALGIFAPVFGMVKDDRHRTRALVTPDGAEIGIDTNPAAFALIGTIQEETHRFAIEFHREKRGKSVKKSKLDEIPGVGEVRRRALIKAFGSLTKIQSASLEELERIVPKNAASAVYEFFRTEDK
ncbi:MAG: excinuclease ABC subunit UvrC [Oscillospiraceae bacterium]|jgi:excinuclease ABC subunit C|nr:excinuclease ABC subunit UvrC [Oscillospiraceae bacterium]